jgi:UDP-glucose:(heptosyl)LPS alpha-1,3-glucosyltransferase
MKLVLIRRRFSATGGAELYLQRLLQALLQQGHEPHLFAEAWNEKPAGVALHPVKVQGTRAQKAVCFAEQVRRELAGEKFDCVFSLERTLKQDVYRAGDGVHRVWLARRRQFAPWWKRPLIGLGAFHRTMQELEAQTLHPQNTRHVIVNAEMVKREILQHFSFPVERIHLVRNGVDIGRFQTADRAAARAHFGFPPHQHVLLFVGSGWERKGLKFLLRAVQHLQSAGPQSANLRLLVVGGGKIPMNAPPDVLFAGPLANVEQAYAAADLFVTLPIYEPSANVVIEALAAGLPVITTACNGASELIEDNVHGTVLDDPADTTRVVEAINFWAARKFCTAPMRAEELSLERNVSQTLAVLELAASEKAG